MSATDESRSKWDVKLPRGGGSSEHGRAKTLLSVLVLVALLLGPVITSDRNGSKDKAARDAGRPAVALGVDYREAGEAEGNRSISNADSAGTHYERYFPGRQAM